MVCNRPDKDQTLVPER